MQIILMESSMRPGSLMRVVRLVGLERVMKAEGMILLLLEVRNYVITTTS